MSSGWALEGLRELTATLEADESKEQALEQQLRDVRNRLAHARKLAEELRVHVGADAVTSEANQAPSRPLPVEKPVDRLDPAKSDLAPRLPTERRDAEPPEEPTKRIVRIRSTSLVADMVRDEGREITRDEVVEFFLTRGLAPKEWQDPRNAIGNALSRAAKSGLIRQIDRDTFGPLEAAPSEEAPNWEGNPYG